MEIVKLSFHDEEEDQNSKYPAFVYLEAYAEDGTSVDYESFDSIQMGFQDYLRYAKHM